MREQFEKLPEIAERIGICIIATVLGWLLGCLIGYIVEELLK